MGLGSLREVYAGSVRLGLSERTKFTCRASAVVFRTTWSPVLSDAYLGDLHCIWDHCLTCTGRKSNNVQYSAADLSYSLIPSSCEVTQLLTRVVVA